MLGDGTAASRPGLRWERFRTSLSDEESLSLAGSIGAAFETRGNRARHLLRKRNYPLYHWCKLSNKYRSYSMQMDTSTKSNCEQRRRPLVSKGSGYEKTMVCDVTESFGHLITSWLPTKITSPEGLTGSIPNFV